MWTIEVENPGKNSRLVQGSRQIPDVNPHEILIKTYAAGLNRADIFQKQGLYAPPVGASGVLGLEISGIVEKIGDKVTNFKPGDEVCALLEGGGYAEYASVPASQVLPLPENYDFIQGASLPEALFTVYSNIFHHAKMQKGESLLIHGGASGIGTFAIQIAREFGIECYTTAGSDEKCKFLKKLGASHAINYKDADFAEEIALITKGQGVDVVIDIIGAEYSGRNIKCLKQGGRLVLLSFLSGAKVEANLAPLLFKNLTVTGTALRTKTTAQKAEIARDLQKNIWPLLENGKIKPIIDATFNFQDAESAHKLMESGGHIGKIILKCD